MPGIFLSHSSRDRALANELLNLLRIGSGVPQQAIFCSSGPGTGVPAGQRFNHYIRAQVCDASVVVALLTPSFLRSPFCLAEIGAAWALQDDFFPLMAPGVDPQSFGGILDGTQIRSIQEPEALAELHDRVTAALGLSVPTETWRNQQQRFLDCSSQLFADLQIPPPVQVNREEIEQSVRSSLRTHSGGDALFTFDDPEATAFPEFVTGAESVAILGRTAVNVLGQYEHVFRQLLTAGCRVRLLIVNPDSSASKYLYGQRETVFKRNHAAALEYLGSLRDFIDQGVLQIRACDESPPFSVVIAKRPAPHVSQLNMQLNLLYSRVGRDRPILRLAEGDRWYYSIIEEYEALWKRGQAQTYDG